MWIWCHYHFSSLPNTICRRSTRNNSKAANVNGLPAGEGARNYFQWILLPHPLIHAVNRRLELAEAQPQSSRRAVNLSRRNRYRCNRATQRLIESFGFRLIWKVGLRNNKLASRLRLRRACLINLLNSEHKLRWTRNWNKSSFDCSLSSPARNNTQARTAAHTPSKLLAMNLASRKRP